MKMRWTVLACVGLSSALWAAGKTSVDVEMHNSTTSLSMDNDIRSSTSTTTSLAGSSDSVRLDDLVTNLRTPNERGRLKALNDVTALGSKAKPVIPDLQHLLLDPMVGASSARALLAVDPNTSVPASTLARLVRRAQMPPQHARVRNGSLAECDEQIHSLDTLAALGAAAHSTLPDLVKLSHRFCVHDHVVAALDAIGTPDASQIAQIAAGLDDKNPETRQAAIEYLVKSHSDDESTVKILGHAMNDADSGVRLSALQALEGIHPEGEGRLPLLAAFIQDASPAIRERAVYMIGQVAPGTQTSKPLLYQALKDSEPTIVFAAANQLAKLDPQDPALQQALLADMKVRGSAQAMQAAQILQSLNVHNAPIDAALEPYRAQLALNSSTVAPEQVAENARSLKVSSIRIASGIINDQPMHVGRHFPGDVGRLYCWTDVSVSSAPAAMIHRWYKNGKLVHEERLDLSQPTAQLWSSMVATKGDWLVKIFPAGSQDALASAQFTVHSRHTSK